MFFASVSLNAIIDFLISYAVNVPEKLEKTGFTSVPGIKPKLNSLHLVFMFTKRLFIFPNFKSGKLFKFISNCSASFFSFFILCSLKIKSSRFKRIKLIY